MIDYSPQPKISMMGEEVSYDDLPGTGAISLDDHFKPVKLSPKAIDEASKIVPSEHWVKYGLYTWLRSRAEHVFKHMPASKTEGKLGIMKYFFEYGADGPVLKSVSLTK
jgi:hypothetical protein